MALIPAEITLLTVEEFDDFSVSVSFTDSETLLPAEIVQVQPSLVNNSIEILISGSNVIIQGFYSEIFTEKTFQYIPIEDESQLVTSFLPDVPESIFALIKYTADNRLSKTITYTVVSTSGSAIISQTITNNWDSGKLQMLNILSRGIN
jgi:hypothetical protein